jgi:hypothetical protein
MIITSKDGYQLPRPNTAERDSFDASLESWRNDMRRQLVGSGLDLIQPGGQVIDPSGHVDVLVSLLSATIKMPKRKLFGSELGKLASSEDGANWAGVISNRRTNYAEPVILRPLIDLLISIGTVPAPTKGMYSFEWKPLFEQDSQQQATTAKTYAEALSTAAMAAAQGAIDMPTFRATLTPFPADIDIDDSFDADENIADVEESEIDATEASEDE